MKKAFAFISLLTVASLIAISCKKSSTTSSSSSTSTSTTGSNNSVNINSTPQVSYNLSGTSHSYISNGSTIQGNNGTSKSLGTNGSASTVIYSSDIDDGNSVTYLNINKGKLTFTNGSSPDSTTFKNYFAVGSVPYSVNALNGIEITMYDGTTTWSTSTGAQTNSTFSFTAVKEQWQLGSQYMKVIANFSCTLYDPSGANPKTITNGVYVGYFGN